MSAPKQDSAAPGPESSRALSSKKKKVAGHWRGRPQNRLGAAPALHRAGADDGVGPPFRMVDMSRALAARGAYAAEPTITAQTIRRKV